MGPVITFLLLLLPLLASGATYYVATTGNNSTGDGSLGNPWADIRYGCLQMAGGDTLNIRAGTYGLYLYTLVEIPSGTPGSPTRVQSYQNESVIYAPSTNTLDGESFHTVKLSNRSNIVLNGWTLNATNASSDGLKLDGTTHNIIVTNMTIFGCPTGHGILTSSDSLLNATITHCRIITNGWNATGLEAPLHQLYLQSHGVTVEYCYIEGVTNVGGGTLGIHAFGSETTNGVYRNNYITNCSTGIGILGRGMTNHWVYNNIIVGGESWGISCYNGTRLFILNNTCSTNAAGINIENCTNVSVVNNIAFGSDGGSTGGIAIVGSDTVGVSNNLACGNFSSGTRSYDYSEINSTGITTNANRYAVALVGGVMASNEIYTPAFRNIQADTRLTTGSSAIGAAQVLSLFAGDYTDYPRTLPWEIGALEFTDAPRGKLRRIKLR